MKRKNLLSIISILVVIGMILCITKLLIHYEVKGEWLGYYGSIIGAVFGVFGAYFIMRIQLNEEHEKNDKQNRENERPYFFIKPLDEGKNSFSFYFYNKKNSIIKNVCIVIKENKIIEEGIEYKKYSIGECKSDKACIVKYDDNLFLDNEYCILYGETLFEESFLFCHGKMFGTRKYDGCSFIYDSEKNKKIYQYTGSSIEQKEFQQLLENIEGIELIDYDSLLKIEKE